MTRPSYRMLRRGSAAVRGRCHHRRRSADIEEIRSVGDDVIVSLTWRFDDPSSPVLASVYHVVRVEGDWITRIRVFLDEADAAHAALGRRRG